jgi:GNAT superfamily N-acetyltransferase
MTTNDNLERQWRLRPPTPDDRQRWRALYQGYADFYRVEQTDAAADRVWSWIHDPSHEVNCILAEDERGHVVGLAHYRTFARPLAASIGCFLDDLFVDPAARGGGAADALLAELRRRAGTEGWSVVRWITADDNYRGRAKYDQHATRTSWITYDMAPGPAGDGPPPRKFGGESFEVPGDFDAPLPRTR